MQHTRQTHHMRVTKRDGTLEEVKFDEISLRLKALTEDLDIDPLHIAKLVCSRLVDKIRTSELDDLAAHLCASLVVDNTDFETLGVRILTSSHEKETPFEYSKVADILQENKDEDGATTPILDSDFYDFITTHREEVDEHFREYMKLYKLFPMSIFGWRTLYRSYLLKSNRKVVERPEHLFYRLALYFYRDDWSAVKDTFSGLMQAKYIHATPTLYHAGTVRPQQSSCFLLGSGDSIEEIFKTLSDTAKISKWAGGVGFCISNIRAKNSYIRGTNGHSNGIMPMLKVFNDTSRYIDQGGGKRKGSFAAFIEPWHADILDFVYAKRNIGNEEDRARDLFYGLWIPDIFMKRVEENGKWSLMCPNRCKGLVDAYGDEFDRMYIEYEKEGRFIRQIEARGLWKEIIHSQIETGLPYMMYKDSCNRKSNQNNLGTIRNSNLCTEIVQYSRTDETAVCNLASINLSTCIRSNSRMRELEGCTIFTKSSCGFCKLLKHELSSRNIAFKEQDIYESDNHASWDRLEMTTVPQLFLKDGTHIGGLTETYATFLRPEFDYFDLNTRVNRLVENMNIVINKNYYPTPECQSSNMKHRPIGLGVQGLADLFCKLRLAFDGDEARFLNRKIFETIYFSALSASNRLVSKFGVYDSFEGSMLSKGVFHFDNCDNFDYSTLNESPTYDWDSLRRKIVNEGLCNSLLIAPMPTASTSQILNQNECIEPFTSNLYVRRTLAGEFTIFNRYLMEDLKTLGIWNQDTIDYLIVQRGSVVNFAPLPTFLRKIYRTAWEIPQKSLIDMASERQWFIDQSQSFNLFVADPSFDKLTKMHFYGWKKGLKTGSYYVRTKPQNFSQNVTIDPSKEQSCSSCSA